MNETKLSKPAIANPRDQEPAAPERKAAEIRLLDEMELVLAAGGDHTIGWP